MLLLTCLSLVYAMFALHRYEPFTFTKYDPGWMVRTVMSIVEDGDLDLRNQLGNDPKRASDQTSQGVAGEWYPVHEYLMPILTVPFYVLLGINGCLVFNILVVILLMLALYHLCNRHADCQSSFTAVVLTAFPTLFLEYSYSYSLDVFSAFALVLAYLLAVRNRFFLAGLAWGFAVYARLANCVTAVGFLPFLIMAGWSGHRRMQGAPSITTPFKQGGPVARFLLGGLGPGSCYLLGNWWMFGSPFVTSYDRWQHFVDGHPVINTLRSGFTCPVIERLPKVLLDTQSGLLIGGPLIIVAVGYGIHSLWREARDEAILMILTCGATIALFSKYCEGHPGTPGNRYLMPVVALCAIPLALALRNCFFKHGNRTEGTK